MWAFQRLYQHLFASSSVPAEGPRKREETRRKWSCKPGADSRGGVTSAQGSEPGIHFWRISDTLIPSSLSCLPSFLPFNKCIGSTYYVQGTCGLGPRGVPTLIPQLGKPPLALCSKPEVCKQAAASPPFGYSLRAQCGFSRLVK